VFFHSKLGVREKFLWLRVRRKAESADKQSTGVCITFYRHGSNLSAIIIPADPFRLLSLARDSH
jgi:hypothetical protein